MIKHGNPDLSRYKEARDLAPPYDAKVERSQVRRSVTAFAASLLDAVDATAAQDIIGVAPIPEEELLPAPGAKGNILVSDGTAWVTRAVGADATVLTADSTEDDGVEWA